MISQDGGVMMAEHTVSSTHPLPPPTTEEDRVSWLRLLRSHRVGISTFFRLMHEHGSAAAALKALPDIARKAGLENYAACSAERVGIEIRAGAEAQARLIFFGNEDYPKALMTIASPPPILWITGNSQTLLRPMVAIVGARNASSLGTRMARYLAKGLGELGYVTVSGLARGVDTAAHKGALKTGTVAVMAGGVDILYPAENAKLGDELNDQGARISEQPMGVIPKARHFPSRNRLISGLCSAVIIVEAASKSGSLITARDALDQGREVLAVPGHPFDARAAGCNMLLRDGAVLVRSVDDVVQVLNAAENEPTFAEPVSQVTQNISQIIPSEAIKKPQRSLRQTANLHQEVLARLNHSPIAEDQLVRDVGGSVSTLSPVLVDLELEGRIKRQAGGLLSLA